jgi:hypothetical protein
LTKFENGDISLIVVYVGLCFMSQLTFEQLQEITTSNSIAIDSISKKLDQVADLQRINAIEIEELKDQQKITSMELEVFTTFARQLFSRDDRRYAEMQLTNNTLAKLQLAQETNLRNLQEHLIAKNVI